tara:strand:+ start:495 stop:1712 length:1218 start_codon:yes stop_codon:yes gene_type:complete
MKKDLKICIMGMGYIGLPTAALLANKGYQIHGVDIDQNIVNTINKGEIHIVEPELDASVKTAVKTGYLTANIKPTESNIFMIAVPTPFHKNINNEVTNSPIPNIDHVKDSIIKIAPYIRPGNLILLESTSPVGTTELIADLLKREEIEIDNIFIAYSPERVLPGNIMRELIENDRVVGGINKISTLKAAEFYRTFVEGKVLETSAKTAEMVKLTENSFRDVNIAFANELSILCDDLDINIDELVSLANKHPRVNILKPGCGVGGHCISVDPWFIVDRANGKAKIIEQARRTNNYKADWVLKKIIKHIELFEKNKKRKPSISCMGLSYKPNIDDLRESPALHIVKELSKNHKIKVVEPNVKYCKDLELVNLEEGLRMDICIYLVAHKEFIGVNIKEEDLNFSGGLD